MEANTTTISIVGILKYLFPTLIGSLLAVWYKRNDVDWNNKTAFQKLQITMIGLGAIVVGCVIGLALSNGIIIYTGVNEFWYQFGIHIFCSLSSLKVLDAIVKNSDEILTILTDGVKKGVKQLIDKIIGR